jgi:hypothetical protein
MELVIATVTRWGKSLLTARAELLTALAFVVGWLLLTDAIARVMVTPLAWRVSIGLLAISLGGWKLFLTMIVNGLYALTRDEAGLKGGG